MNEQTSKERVLKVYPDALLKKSIRLDMGVLFYIGTKQDRIGEYTHSEPEAWNDAASKLPGSPAGEMGTVCPYCLILIEDCIWKGDHEGTLPDSLGPDISGPKGSGGAAPPISDESVGAGMYVRSPQPPVKAIKWTGDNLDAVRKVYPGIGEEYMRDKGCHVGDYVVCPQPGQVRFWNAGEFERTYQSAAPIAPAAQDADAIIEEMRVALKYVLDVCYVPCHHPPGSDRVCPSCQAKAALARAERKEGEAKHV